MFCRICNPTAKNIRICDPKNTPINQKIGSKRIENPYTQFRQIFRCAQQLVQISRHISLVATYPSARAQNCKETAKLMFCRICNPTA